MHSLVSFNGKISGFDNVSVSALSLAALYGKGVFTTIAIHNQEPFLWQKHWLRLKENAVKLGMDLAEFSEAVTKKTLDEIIEKNGVVNGRARVTFFDESSSRIWRFEAKRKTSLLIMTADHHLIPDDFRVTISTNSVSSKPLLAGIKSCNYLENILAIDIAKQYGFDEAIRLNERGEVTSGCMANVFWLKDGQLSTPGLKTGCLPGTTREYILENLECQEVETSETAIYEADAVFMTSAGLGVVAVKELEGKQLREIDHPILNLIPEIPT